MQKEIVWGVVWETRARLIKHGLIKPYESFMELDKDDPIRVAYERKLELAGIEPRNTFGNELRIIIRQPEKESV